MHAWLVTIWEPLPGVDSHGRLLRTGMLANELLRQGWEVTWWASTFDRGTKQQRFRSDVDIEVQKGLQLKLLHHPGYKKNVSLRRIGYHRALALKFREAARRAPRPDVLVCSFPPVETTAAAAEYARTYGVPLVIDVRDPWPDLIAELAPTWAQRLAKIALHPMYRSTAEAFRCADAITGVSRRLVDHGLYYAGRERREVDQEFPIGYLNDDPSSELQLEARRFWRKLGVPDQSQFVICFAGMMGRQSELGTVLRAADRLRETGKSFQFVLCGDGDRTESYRRLAEGNPTVIFPGWLDAPKVWMLMRLSTVGLAPYRSTRAFEACLPNKPFEYFAAGLPVVSSLHGALENLLRDRQVGLTYTNGDVEGLVSILRELHDNPDRVTRMSSTAQSLYKECFAPQVIYPRMAEHVRRVAVRSCDPRGVKGIART